jgi:hypothetical protein
MINKMYDFSESEKGKLKNIKKWELRRYWNWKQRKRQKQKKEWYHNNKKQFQENRMSNRNKEEGDLIRNVFKKSYLYRLKNTEKL